MVRILDQLALDDEFGQLLCDFLVNAALYLLFDEDDDLLNHHLEALRHLGIYELVQISNIVIEVYFFAAFLPLPPPFLPPPFPPCLGGADT